jgi:predicted RNA-binding Zn ribbon-like protein
MAAALVNLLTEGEDRSRKYLPPDGAQRTEQLNELFSRSRSKTVVTGVQAQEFVPVAAALRVVFTAVAGGDIDAAARHVNDMLTAAGAHPVLEQHDGEPWHIHFNSSGGGSLARSWQAGCATGLAVVLGGELYDRLGVCTAPHCDRVYVDTSRNGSRRYCSTACQNRVKAAAFRGRRQGGD